MYKNTFLLKNKHFHGNNRRNLSGRREITQLPMTGRFIINKLFAFSMRSRLKKEHENRFKNLRKIICVSFACANACFTRSCRNFGHYGWPSGEGNPNNCCIVIVKIFFKKNTLRTVQFFPGPGRRRFKFDPFFRRIFRFGRYSHWSFRTTVKSNDNTIDRKPNWRYVFRPHGQRGHDSLFFFSRTFRPEKRPNPRLPVRHEFWRATNGGRRVKTIDDISFSNAPKTGVRSNPGLSCRFQTKGIDAESLQRPTTRRWVGARA